MQGKGNNFDFLNRGLHEYLDFFNASVYSFLSQKKKK